MSKIVPDGRDMDQQVIKLYSREYHKFARFQINTGIHHIRGMRISIGTTIKNHGPKGVINYPSMVCTSSGW
jgi:hypothetical protein